MSLSDNGWSYSRTIYVSSAGVSENQTDFPVEIDGSVIPDDVFSNAQSLGQDIRITTDSIGTNEVPVQVLNFHTSGMAEIWFKAPSIVSSADNVFYLWYGNTSASVVASADTYGSNNVWTNDYFSVWHMNNQPNNEVDVVDATGNSYNLNVPTLVDIYYETTSADDVGEETGSASTVYIETGIDADGTPHIPALFDGILGYALHFEDNDYIYKDEVNETIDDFTFSTWVQTSANDQGDISHGIFNTRTSGQGYDENFQISISPETSSWIFSAGSTSAFIGNITEDVWEQISITFDNSTSALTTYFNGASADSVSDIKPNEFGAFDFGRNRDRDLYLDAVVDYSYITSAVKDPSWIETTYNLQDNKSYVVVGQHVSAVSLETPVIELSAIGQKGHSGTADISLPNIELYGDSTTTRQASADLDLSTIEVAAVGNRGQSGTAGLDLLSIEVAAVGNRGQSGTAGLDLSTIELSATGKRGQFGTAYTSLPNIELSAVGTASKQSSADLDLSTIELLATGKRGQSGTADLDLPPIEVAAVGNRGQSGTADLTLPQIESVGSGAGVFITITFDSSAKDYTSYHGQELILSATVVHDNVDHVMYPSGFSINSLGTFTGTSSQPNNYSYVMELSTTATGELEVSATDDIDPLSMPQATASVDVTNVFDSASLRTSAERNINLVNLLPVHLEYSETGEFLEFFETFLNEMYDEYAVYRGRNDTFEVDENGEKTYYAVSADDNGNALTSATTITTSAGTFYTSAVPIRYQIQPSPMISILEKTKRLTDLQDPDLIDIEYIQNLANFMGYDINVHRDDINDVLNTGIDDYETQKYLRHVVSNLPYWYRIKSTKNAIKALLYSFGVVGELIKKWTSDELATAENHPTIGGYGNDLNLWADFNQTSASSSLSAMPDNYFPTPHFAIRIDLNTTPAGWFYNIDKILQSVESIRPVNAVLDSINLLFNDTLETLYIRTDTYTTTKMVFPFNTEYPPLSAYDVYRETGSAGIVYRETGTVDSIIETGP